MIGILLAQAQCEVAHGISIAPLGVLLVCVPLLGIIWLIRYLIRSDKERRRLRLEVGKLADEVHRLQQGNPQKSDK